MPGFKVKRQPDGRETAIYPACCTSAYCGGSGADCAGCASKPTLDAFKEWVQTNKAFVNDPVWSPLSYTGTVSH